MKSCNLTKDQREMIVERVEDHIDSTSYDWQLDSDDVHNDAIASWADIIRELGFKARGNKLERDYSI